jgi:hypothetical protein
MDKKKNLDEKTGINKTYANFSVLIWWREEAVFVEVKDIE